MEVREVEPKGNEKNDETERGVVATLEAVMDEKIEELDRVVLSESNGTIVEVGEAREMELDEITEVSERVEAGPSTEACKMLARRLRRKRRSLSKVVSDFQILGRSSGSLESWSSVKYMVAFVRSVAGGLTKVFTR